MDETVASLVDEGQNSVSRIIRQETKTDLLPPKRKGRCRRKRKTTQKDDAFLIRNSKLNLRVLLISKNICKTLGYKYVLAVCVIDC